MPPKKDKKGVKSESPTEYSDNDLIRIFASHPIKFRDIEHFIDVIESFLQKKIFSNNIPITIQIEQQQDAFPQRGSIGALPQQEQQRGAPGKQQQSRKEFSRILKDLCRFYNLDIDISLAVRLYFNDIKITKNEMKTFWETKNVVEFLQIFIYLMIKFQIIGIFECLNVYQNIINLSRDILSLIEIPRTESEDVKASYRDKITKLYSYIQLTYTDRLASDTDIVVFTERFRTLFSHLYEDIETDDRLFRPFFLDSDHTRYTQPVSERIRSEQENGGTLNVCIQQFKKGLSVYLNFIIGLFSEKKKYIIGLINYIQQQIIIINDIMQLVNKYANSTTNQILKIYLYDTIAFILLNSNNELHTILVMHIDGRLQSHQSHRCYNMCVNLFNFSKFISDCLRTILNSCLYLFDDRNPKKKELIKTPIFVTQFKELIIIYMENSIRLISYIRENILMYELIIWSLKPMEHILSFLLNIPFYPFSVFYQSFNYLLGTIFNNLLSTVNSSTFIRDTIKTDLNHWYINILLNGMFLLKSSNNLFISQTQYLHTFLSQFMTIVQDNLPTSIGDQNWEDSFYAGIPILNNTVDESLNLLEDILKTHNQILQDLLEYRLGMRPKMDRNRRDNMEEQLNTFVNITILPFYFSLCKSLYGSEVYSPRISVRDLLQNIMRHLPTGRYFDDCHAVINKAMYVSTYHNYMRDLMKKFEVKQFIQGNRELFKLEPDTRSTPTPSVERSTKKRTSLNLRRKSTKRRINGYSIILTSDTDLNKPLDVIETQLSKQGQRQELPQVVQTAPQSAVVRSTTQIYKERLYNQQQGMKQHPRDKSGLLQAYYRLMELEKNNKYDKVIFERVKHLLIYAIQRSQFFENLFDILFVENRYCRFETVFIVDYLNLYNSVLCRYNATRFPRESLLSYKNEMLREHINEIKNVILSRFTDERFRTISCYFIFITQKLNHNTFDPDTIIGVNRLDSHHTLILEVGCYYIDQSTGNIVYCSEDNVVFKRTNPLDDLVLRWLENGLNFRLEYLKEKLLERRISRDVSYASSLTTSKRMGHSMGRVITITNDKHLDWYRD